MNSKLFAETMQGLIEATAVERGVVDVSKVSDMPYETYRVTDNETAKTPSIKPDSDALVSETPNVDTLEAFYEVDNGNGTRFAGSTDDFISRINPYEKPRPLKFDLRGYSKFVTENNLSADEITDKIMEKFKTK